MSESFEQDQRVCLKGYGTAAIVHEHTTVLRVTRTQVVTLDRRTGEAGRRYFKNNLHEVGSTGGYGGTTISGTCQVKKEQR